MKKSKLKTVCALFLAGVLGATGLVGCNSNEIMEMKLKVMKNLSII